MCYRKTAINILILLSPFFVFSQDTLKITIAKGDSIFLKNNFNVLASYMNIEAQTAQIIQAKLYPNPTFSLEVDAYDTENKKPFFVGQAGQKSFQIEQLIILGKKRKSEIDIAKTNSKISQVEFQQLLLELKYSLHTNLFKVGLQQQLIERYTKQLDLLSSLLNIYEAQANKGNIPLNYVVRLKGAYLKLNNDRSDLLKDYLEAQKELQTILQTNSIVAFSFSDNDIEKYIQLKQLSQLKADALDNKPELLLAKINKELAEQYWLYQKRLAVPDVTVQVAYDQRSGAFRNQISTGISIPLPLWNKNQGNIKASAFKIKEANYSLESVKASTLINLQNEFDNYTKSVSEYQKAKSLYNEDFDLVSKGMSDNFQKRNISILEFMDFFENYNDVQTELTRIKTKLVQSAERINFLTGKDNY